MTFMIRDQIESFRYANHMWPLLLLRWYVSYKFFAAAAEKQLMNYLKEPRLSAAIDEHLFAAGVQVPSWVSSFYLNWVQDSWQLWSGVFINLEWTLGLLFLIGFLNRPAALIGAGYLYLTSYIGPAAEWTACGQLIVILFVLALFGSGRVGGVDYFFYKRQRGLLW